MIGKEWRRKVDEEWEGRGGKGEVGMHELISYLMEKKKILTIFTFRFILSIQCNLHHRAILKPKIMSLSYQYRMRIQRFSYSNFFF